MTTNQSDKENEKLFAQMSSAIRNQEFDKIDELATSPEQEDTPTPEEHEEGKAGTPDPKDMETSPEDGDKEIPADEEQPEEDKDKKKETPAAKTDQEKLTEALALLDKVKQENHSLRSQAGRVPHLQRQVQQIDKKLEELKEQATSPSSRPSTKLTERITPKLAKIKDADPELADVLAELLADATDGVATDLWDAEAKSLQAQRQAVAQEIQDAEVSRLIEMYPNAEQVFKSPSWKSWEAKQSKQLQMLANSDSADDVAFAFERYAEDMVKLHPQLAQKKNEESSPNNDEAARIEAERQRKKQTTVVVGSPTPAGRQQKPENDEALFKQFSEQIRKEITG